MNDALVYLDSSAVIKLVFEEPETASLEQLLGSWPNRVSSVIAEVEVLRVVLTVGDAVVTQHARDLLARVHLIRFEDTVRTMAATIEPVPLRALDSIHLATALSLGSALAGMVVYDVRLAAAARGAGLTVWAPA